MTPLLKESYEKLGDFLQRLQAIITAATTVAGLFLALYAFIFLNLSAEQTATLFLVVSAVLTLVASFELFYLIRVRRQKRRLEEIVESYLLKDMLRTDLEQSDRLCDKELVAMLQSRGIPAEERRRRCVSTVLLACRDNILNHLAAHEKRIAFLEYDPASDRFTVVAHLGLVHESSADVASSLRREQGLAGQAIKLRTTQYEPDVTLPAAQQRGWIRIGSELRHQSITCVDAWVSDQPIGALCADSVVSEAFSSDDIEIVEHFGEKIELIYSVFPKPPVRDRRPNTTNRPSPQR